MTRITFALAALVSTALPAFAHPGHILDHGQGHSHIFALIALGLAGIGAGALAAQALIRRRRARTAGKS